MQTNKPLLAGVPGLEAPGSNRFVDSRQGDSHPDSRFTDQNQIGSETAVPARHPGGAA